MYQPCKYKSFSKTSFYHLITKPEYAWHLCKLYVLILDNIPICSYKNKKKKTKKCRKKYEQATFCKTTLTNPLLIRWRHLVFAVSHHMKNNLLATVHFLFETKCTFITQYDMNRLGWVGENMKNYTMQCSRPFRATKFCFVHRDDKIVKS